jgi:VCBS repeat-containing protein
MTEPVLVEIGTVVTMVGYGPYGTITANIDGVITITPYPGYETAAVIGLFDFAVPDGAITDLSGNPFTGSIGLEVLNVAPVAVDDAYSVAEDGVLTVAARGVLINDTDFDPSILTAILEVGPANGTLVLNADGSFTYTPAANFHGTDTFTYTANDETLASNIATVTITVSSVNDSPVAVDDEYEVDEDSVLTIAAPGVLENDTDIDLDNMVVALVSTVSHGELVLLGDGSFTYTPEPDYYGEDSFVYELVSYPAIQAGWTDTATVTITVNPINDAPVAQSQSVTTPEETAKDITLVATDIENDSLTYEIVAQPANGTVTLVGTTATYTPNLNFVGEDNFTFKAKDTTLDSNIATVTITVTPVNDAPVAVDDTYTMAEKETLTIAAPGVLENDIDVDGDTLTVTLVDDVQNGTLTLNADGSFVYTPNEYFNSTDSFTYVASDGTLESELAEVVITVTPVNDWPIANDDSYETVTGVLLDVAAPGVLENDVLLDPDEVVSILILDEPQHGTLSMNNDGSFTYTPDAGFMGTDTFRYQLNSVQLHAEWSDDALVTIVVKPYMGLFLPIIWR